MAWFIVNLFMEFRKEDRVAIAAVYVQLPKETPKDRERFGGIFAVQDWAYELATGYEFSKLSWVDADDFSDVDYKDLTGYLIEDENSIEEVDPPHPNDNVAIVRYTDIEY